MSNVNFVLLLLLLLASSTSGEANQLLARDNSGGWGSGGSVSGTHSFFDIALTALAFLSFGIFLLNLLLNALMFTSSLPGLTSTGPIITMTAPTATGGATGGATGVATGYRRKRSIDEIEEAMFSIAPNVGAEVLATSALKSLKVLLDGEKSHHCLPSLYCEGVRQGGVVGRGFQYLMPLFTLSSSYIGERLGLHSSLPTHLDAILVGFGGSIPCSSKFTRCPAGKSEPPNSSPSNSTKSNGDSRSNSG